MLSPFVWAVLQTRDRTIFCHRLIQPNAHRIGAFCSSRQALQMSMSACALMQPLACKGLSVTWLCCYAMFVGPTGWGQWCWSAPLPFGHGTPQHHASDGHQPTSVGRGRRGPMLRLPSRCCAPPPPPGKHNCFESALRLHDGFLMTH